MKTSRSGSALIAVVFLIAVISMTLAIVFATTTAEAKFGSRAADRAVAMAYGDGVLESLYDQWRIAMTDAAHMDTNQRTIGLSTDELMSATKASGVTTMPVNLPLTLPTATTLPVPNGVSLTSWSVKAADPYLQPLATSSARPTGETGSSSRQRVRVYYLAEAKVAYPRGGSVVVRRIFTRSGRNLFDNFLYSTQPVTEIHPGAPMYVNGTVYVGGDLYMAHNTLHLQQDVQYTGEKYLNFKGGAQTGETNAYWDSRYGSETPSISSTAWPANNAPHKGAEQKLLDTPESSLDPNFTDDISSNDVNSDGNPNNDGYYEIVKEVSDTTKSDPLKMDTSGTSQRLSENADYRIYVDAAGAVTVYKGNSTTALTGTEATTIKAAITTNTSIQDAREGDYVRMVNVDVGAITTGVNAGNIKDSVGNSDGLLLYINDKSAGTSVTTKGYVSSGGAASKVSVTSTRSRGVRLINGGSLPSMGLSIASPNPVYIQGDYNTGATSATKPPSDASGAYSGTTDPDYVTPTYNRAPAVVVGDSVNILSNNWSDSTAAVSQAAGAPPTATATTINTAIVAGNVPTTNSNVSGGSYSGGVENYPRFHENWTSIPFTVHGSFALLFDSMQAKGVWADALYNPPDRHWYFDSILQSKNPPGFPAAYSYDRGRWTWSAK